MKKPLILITNDDGIRASGIRHLINIMRNIGDVVVVAPDSPQSAQSHSITIKHPLMYKTIEISESYKEYSLNGTPVDCVKFALHKLIGEKRPDIIVSGVNHGSNASINVIYSGTMGAAIEGAMANIPSVGFSLLDHSEKANFEYTTKHIIDIVKKVLAEESEENICLNVNFPRETGKEYLGLKICQQAKAYWKEDFDERFDPRTGEPYYWLQGAFTTFDEYGKQSDEWALDRYYVSVVPIKFDFTAYEQINKLKKWEE